MAQPKETARRRSSRADRVVASKRAGCQAPVADQQPGSKPPPKVEPAPIWSWSTWCVRGRRDKDVLALDLDVLGAGLPVGGDPFAHMAAQVIGGEHDGVRVDEGHAAAKLPSDSGKKSSPWLLTKIFSIGTPTRRRRTGARSWSSPGPGPPRRSAGYRSVPRSWMAAWLGRRRPCSGRMDHIRHPSAFFLHDTYLLRELIASSLSAA